MAELIQHHVKYQEIDGVDEIRLMTTSEHKLLHNKLRLQGLITVPVDELTAISKKAHQRTTLRKQTQKIDRYEYELKNIQFIFFSSSVAPYVHIFEKIRYNKTTGKVSVLSYFHTNKNHDLK